MQIIVDQNLINGALGQFLKIEKAYSLRDLLNVDPRLAVMKQLLTTTSVGMLRNVTLHSIDTLEAARR